MNEGDVISNILLFFIGGLIGLLSARRKSRSIIIWPLISAIVPFFMFIVPFIPTKRSYNDPERKTFPGLVEGSLVLLMAIGTTSYAVNNYTNWNTLFKNKPSNITVTNNTNGHILDFKLYESFYNRDNNGGKDSHITVMVDGGSKDDWVITALYLAKMVKNEGMNSGVVDVVIKNPWFTRIKKDDFDNINLLSRVIFDSGDKYKLYYAEKYPPYYFIEYNEYHRELIDSNVIISNNISEKIKENNIYQITKAQSDAEKYIKKKYSLSNLKTPFHTTEYGITKNLELSDNDINLYQYINDKTVTNERKIESCLNSSNGDYYSKGCFGRKQEEIIPYNMKNSPLNWYGHTLKDVNVKPYSKCSIYKKYMSRMIILFAQGDLSIEDRKENFSWLINLASEHNVNLEFMTGVGSLSQEQENEYQERLLNIQSSLAEQCLLNTNQLIYQAMDKAIIKNNIPHYKFYSDND